MPQNKNGKQKVKNTQRKEQSKRRKDLSKQQSKPDMRLRTNESVSRDLSRSAPRPSLVSGTNKQYAMCRLNPFMGNGGTMYPGGGNAPVIVVDHRTFSDFQFSAGAKSAHIRILPSAPFGAIMHLGATTGAMVVSNNKIINDAYGPMPTTGTDTETSWYPLNVMQEWGTASFPGAGTIAPYNATRARVISCGFKLYYTGIANICQGIVSMTPGSLSVVSRETLPFGVDIRTNADALGTTIVANSSDAIQIDGNVVSNPCLPQTVTVRVEQGASGTLTQISEKLEFRPVCQGGAVVFADGKTTNLVCSTTGIRGAVGFYDESWSPVDIFIGNASNSVSMRLEVVTCVEYQIDTSSDIARFARKPPTPDPLLLTSLSAAINKVSSVGDGSTLEKNMSALLPYIKSGTKLVSSLAALAM